jgi:sec-independent protein translocase protein TatA
MGLGGISIWQLLIILVIVVLIFGTKRLKTLGGDVGGALKSFRKAMDSDDSATKAEEDKEPKQISTEGDKEPDAEFAEQKDQQSQS